MADDRWQMANDINSSTSTTVSNLRRQKGLRVPLGTVELELFGEMLVTGCAVFRRIGCGREVDDMCRRVSYMGPSSSKSNVEYQNMCDMAIINGAFVRRRFVCRIRCIA